ncbi:Recombination-promoting nuclease RpnD [Candidatus Magnetaquicoccaceae bacterium FCR-1]|uniref:Recombination-promoting nuclease RpnD n=1 Tax=Candidatus Magnetaquiglobus chichijimensis TaxID=3141448 RepID=A0ABQ0C7P0_9PROT
MNEITQPHDRFLKSLLSDPEKAGTLLRERLPEAISELLSSDPPELVEGSFVDEELRGLMTDRLFRVRTIHDRVALLYVLIDHKSHPDPFIGFQLLKYQIEAWKQWARENPDWKRLPAIVPFVFYHGETEWRIPNEFMALVDAEAGWRPFLLNFQFPIFDLGKVQDDQLSQHARLRAWLVAAKYATRSGKQTRIKKHLIEVLGDSGVDFPVIMRYIVETYDEYNESIVQEIIHAVRPEEEHAMMSQFARDIIAKGKPEWLNQGRMEGRQEEAASLLLKLIRHKFGPTPDWMIEQIKTAHLEQIEAWSDNFVFANSVEEVFAS